MHDGMLHYISHVGICICMLAYCACMLHVLYAWCILCLLVGILCTHVGIVWLHVSILCMDVGMVCPRNCQHLLSEFHPKWNLFLSINFTFHYESIWQPKWFHHHVALIATLHILLISSFQPPLMTTESLWMFRLYFRFHLWSQTVEIKVQVHTEELWMKFDFITTRYMYFCDVKL